MACLLRAFVVVALAIGQYGCGKARRYKGDGNVQCSLQKAAYLDVGTDPNVVDGALEVEVGVGMDCGRLTAEEWDVVAQLPSWGAHTQPAFRAGATYFRVTPWVSTVNFRRDRTSDTRDSWITHNTVRIPLEWFGDGPTGVVTLQGLYWVYDGVPESASSRYIGMVHIAERFELDLSEDGNGYVSAVLTPLKSLSRYQR